ncbi:BQ2448_6257 [Microbotryum intermedium]|uniref:non-specific serine/threonine protein kinase n=1 Tax=Microbotryum intermedium TaxID=269621 RepID=A0A238FKQ1_9BASI|nr:BQ2448_6257 [Microbotryum intermedium]
MSSWKIGKKIKEAARGATSSSSSSTPAAPAAPIQPAAAAPSSNRLTASSAAPPSVAAPSPSTSGPPISRSGVLTIRVVEARHLSLPQGGQLPTSIQSAVDEYKSSVSRNRDSAQRKQTWWLPYVVLEFDKNEVLVDAMGGELSAPVWMFRGQFDVSRVSDVTISAYLRTAPVAAGGNRNDMGNDLFLGGINFTPVFDPNQASDQWYAASSGAGEFHIQVAFKPGTNEAMSIDAFDLLKVIGKGSFGKVMQVRKKDTGRIYALKTLRKAHIVSRSEVTHTLAERTVLAQVNNPFIVPLKFSFQNAEKLYLVLAFVNGGELFHHLQKEGRFSEERSRFYAAELLCALEHLHSFNVIYRWVHARCAPSKRPHIVLISSTCRRDLKPENILIDYVGHIALCDFGLCKLNMGDSETTNTFCGTPEYLAPELLLGHGYQKTVDWWTLGTLLAEMLQGLPPYYSENTNEMYQKILTDPLKLADDVSPDAKSLIQGLLTRDPAQRLGSNGAEEIKRHPFFSKHIDFDLLMAKKIQPPFKPSVASAADTSNFDTEFTSEAPLDSVVEDSHLSESVQANFTGFTYVQPAGAFGESVR